MDRNVGRTDRVVRIIVGLILIVAPLLNIPAVWSSEVMGYLSMTIGLVLALTAIFGVCPIYAVLGVQTCHRT